MRQLTEKQLKTADLILRGMSEIDAIMETYECKDRNSAYVVNNKLKSNERFKEYLRKGQSLVTAIVETEGRKLAEILNDIFPPKKRAMKLKELAESGDSRVVLQAIQEMSKLDGAYPDAKIGVYHALEEEQKELYMTKADENKLIEEELQKRIKEERTKKLKEASEEATIKE